MVGRNRQCRRTRGLQKPRQVLGFASEFLANGADLGEFAVFIAIRARVRARGTLNSMIWPSCRPLARC